MFVRAAISGVVREALIAGALTGLLILLFLGSWRSTLIITISIPLSILASIVCLSALGETINIMTLGGLALAVGILVDDATVTIENINYHLEQGKDVEAAILDGAHQIALPALVSTLVHLHRVRADVPARGHREIPVHSAGRGRGVRHAGLLHPVAHPGADAREVLAEDARRTRTHKTQQCPERAFRRGSSAASSACASAIAPCWARAAQRPALRRAFSWCAWRRPRCWPFRLGPLPGLGQDFFPSRRRRPDQAAHARPHRHAHRGNGGPLRSRSRRPSARSFRPSRSSTSSTISGCPTAASISPTAPRRRWVRAMPTSTSICAKNHQPTAELRPHAAHRSWRRPIRPRHSRSCPRT